MPIAAGMTQLNSQLETALSMQEGATTAVVAEQIASAVAGVIPLGIFPTAPSPVPLSPSGLSAGKSIIESALSLGEGANQAIVAQLIAQGISLIAPTAPPPGLAILGQSINAAMMMGVGATQQVTAALIGQAVIAYYVSGGVV